MIIVYIPVIQIKREIQNSMKVTENDQRLESTANVLSIAN